MMAKGLSGDLDQRIYQSKESPNLTSGIMQFDHSQLPWTLTYDEMDYVIEGTLEFIVNGKKYTGYPGDSFYIPANTTVTSPRRIMRNSSS